MRLVCKGFLWLPQKRTELLGLATLLLHGLLKDAFGPAKRLPFPAGLENPVARQMILAWSSSDVSLYFSNHISPTKARAPSYGPQDALSVLRCLNIDAWFSVFYGTSFKKDKVFWTTNLFVVFLGTFPLLAVVHDARSPTLASPRPRWSRSWAEARRVRSDFLGLVMRLPTRMVNRILLTKPFRFWGCS